MTRPVSGPVPQGVDESIAYKFDFTKIVATEGSASSISGCTLYNKKEMEYQNALLSGETDLTGNIATSKIVSGLEDGTGYILSVAVLFASGNTLSATLHIRGEI